MLCYSDKTFCMKEDCQDNTCTRKITPEHEARAKKLGLPFSMMDFSNNGCYQPPTNKGDKDEDLLGNKCPF